MEHARTSRALRDSREPRCERLRAVCKARDRVRTLMYAAGSATQQTAPSRRNPKGAWGLGPDSIVARRRRSTRDRLPPRGLGAQAPGARLRESLSTLLR